MSDPELLHPSAAGFEVDPDRPDVAVLIHGWTGSPAHMRLLAERLSEAGFGVIVPRLAGHGTRVEDMVGTGWRDWVEDAAEAAHRVVDGGSRLHLIGLSMGGVIGILLAPAYAAASLTTINAPQQTRSRFTWLGRFLRGSKWLLPSDKGAPPPGEGAAYFHQYGQNPIGTVADMLDLVRAAGAELGSVRCPTLVIQSRTDETVDPRSGEIILRGLGSPDKRLVWLESSRHVATLDHERDVLTAEVLRHLEENTGRQ